MVRESTSAIRIFRSAAPHYHDGMDPDAPPITAHLTADRTALRLSETLSVTLTVQGPDPLRVEPITDPLIDVSAAVWKIDPDGPVVRTAGADGTTRWEQVYRLSPFVPGNEIPVTFRPVRVSGVEVAVPPLTVRVTTSLTAPVPDDVRPVTGVQSLPPPSVERPVGPLFALAVALVIIAAAVLTFFRRRRATVAVSPQEWAVTQLDAFDADLNAGRRPAASTAGRLTDVIRGYLSRRFGLTVDPYTTEELLRAGDRAAVWTTDGRAVVASVLESCDRAKYAGQDFSGDECLRCSRAVRSLVLDWPTPPVE